MTKVYAMRLGATAMALACVSTGSAQQPNIAKLANPAVDTPSCDALSWQKEIVSRYPGIAAACQEVVISNGVPFARFTGELQQVNRDGSVRIDFKDRQGRSLGTPTTLRPAPDQRALIDGRTYRFSELPIGQQLSLYIPEARLVVATEPSAPPEAMAKIVLDEPAATAEQPIEPTRLAEATPPAATAQPNRLPDTAGWTPMLVFAGLLSLVAAIFVGLMRRSQHRDVV